MLERTWAVRRALLVLTKWTVTRNGKTREHTKNLIIFKEGAHKKRKNYPVHCNEIKDLLDDNDV